MSSNHRNNLKNTDIEMRNTKQYRNANFQNSKQKPHDTTISRFGHWYFCHLYLFRVSTCPPMPLCSGCFSCIRVWKRNRHSTLRIKGKGRRVFEFRIFPSPTDGWNVWVYTNISHCHFKTLNFWDGALPTLERGHSFAYTAQPGEGIGSGKDLVQMGQFPFYAFR